MLYFRRLHKFHKPTLNGPYTHTKDFCGLYGVLLGGAIVQVRGRDKKSAGSIWKNCFWTRFWPISPGVASLFCGNIWNIIAA